VPVSKVPASVTSPYRHDDFEPEITLGDLIDLDTGEWL
jgi:hypothetical protein